MMSITQRVSMNNNLKDNSINVIKKTTDKQRRNYGIDLLRIISMINIINLHINLKTGIMGLKAINLKYKTIWRLEIFSYNAVDCFGLISGIVGFNKYKFSNLIYLWFISAFYSVTINAYLFIENKINLKQLFISFFPILIKFHWYVNAYFIMYLFLPFINYGIKLLNVKTFRNLVFFYIFFFSIYYIVSFSGIKNYSFLLNGYSSSWLTILYIIGSYFGKYILENINKSNKLFKCFYLINYISFSFLTSEIFFITRKYTLINYLSPTILFQALCLVMIFYSFEITNKFIIIIIKFITPLVFSVTLIHLILFNLKFKIVLSFFTSIRKLSKNFLFFKIYLLSIILFIFCIIIDFFRFLLFKFFKIKEICLFIEVIFPKIIDKIFLITKINN